MSQGRLSPLSHGSLPRFTQPIFRFPGSFHPPLVGAIVRKHPRAELLGDSMAGCGTSALVGMSMGRNAVVADIDPLACLLTRAKCNPVDPGVLVGTIEWLIDGAGPMGYRSEASGESDWIIKRLERDTPFRAPVHVYHWFHPTIARDLANWLYTIHRNRTSLHGPLFDAVLAVTAGSIRRVSRADPKPVSGVEVTSVRREKLRSGLRFDLARELRSRAALLGDGYSQILAQPDTGRVTVRRWDARNWADLCRRLDAFPDLQLTSPPYLRAIDYSRRHRLENVWLGLVVRESYSVHGRQFLGHDSVGNIERIRAADGLPASCARALARVSERSNEHEALVVKRYLLDLNAWIEDVAGVASEASGNAYVVVGASFAGQTRIDTPRLITDMADQFDLRLTSVTRHRLVNQRMQYTLRQGRRVDSESVLGFRPNN
jgi:hypothetical protein